MLFCCCQMSFAPTGGHVASAVAIVVEIRRSTRADALSARVGGGRIRRDPNLPFTDAEVAMAAGYRPSAIALQRELPRMAGDDEARTQPATSRSGATRHVAHGTAAASSRSIVLT